MSIFRRFNCNMFQNCDGSEVLSGGSDGGTSIFIRLHSTAGLFAPCFVDFSLFFVQKGSKNAPGEAFPYDFGIECEKQRQTSVKNPPAQPVDFWNSPVRMLLFKPALIPTGIQQQGCSAWIRTVLSGSASQEPKARHTLLQSRRRGLR